MSLNEVIASELDAVRHRSLALLDPLTPEQLAAQHSPLMSPLVWDLAHVGNYEDIWLVRALGGEGLGVAHDELYDAFKQPRPTRPSLPLLGPGEARRYLLDVRGRALDLLSNADLDDGDRLTRDGFVYAMVVQHEHQHDETMLATIQLIDGEAVRPTALPPPEPSAVAAGEVLVPGGPFTMGTDDAWSYDNERPAHEVDIGPFWIDRAPVTNGEYREFIDVGGYNERAWWSDLGWAWRQEAGLEHPQFWLPAGGGSWARLRFGLIEELDDAEPVQHICWYEADAYARWAGKRLPAEAEWEKAASWDPATGARRRYPWGEDAPSAARANLGQRHLQPAPVGAYPGGASPVGCHQMLGDVWEWTSSDFTGYPGFGSFPYREYSEVFFGSDYKVLRGGSWATDPTAVRTSFRNWDLPIRRQIFAGFRCARDAR